MSSKHKALMTPIERIRAEVADQQVRIKEWCRQHLGATLAVTDAKDFGMIELWDDRAIQVVKNTGERVGR